MWRGVGTAQLAQRIAVAAGFLPPPPPVAGGAGGGQSLRLPPPKPAPAAAPITISGLRCSGFELTLTFVQVS